MSNIENDERDKRAVLNWNYPCEVELLCMQDGKPLPSDQVIANCIKMLASDWLHYREARLEIVASSYRDRLAAIVEAMKNVE